MESLELLFERNRLVVLSVLIMATIGLIVYYLSIAASLEERAKIITECNARITEANEKLGKCAECLYSRNTTFNLTFTNPAWWEK